MRALGFWGEPTDAKPRQASTDLNLVNLTHLLQAPDAARSDLRRETKRERNFCSISPISSMSEARIAATLRLRSAGAADQTRGHCCERPPRAARSPRARHRGPQRDPRFGGERASLGRCIDLNGKTAADPTADLSPGDPTGDLSPGDHYVRGLCAGNAAMYRTCPV
jgi:hypothetical protein